MLLAVVQWGWGVWNHQYGLDLEPAEGLAGGRTHDSVQCKAQYSGKVLQ